MNNHEFVAINGQIYSASEARISPFDGALLVGDGIFETLKTYQGKAFALSRHYNRLKAGAEKVGLIIPKKAAIAEAIDLVISANQANNSRLRVTVTAGEGDSARTCLVSTADLPQITTTTKTSKAKWNRNEKGYLTGVKSTSYAENVVALREAKSLGCGEAIFANTAGNLCEGTGSNVFLSIQDQQLLTPPLSSGCLPGITRELVIELCKQEGIPVVEEDIAIEQLPNSREAFLTGSLKEIQPIAEFDKKPIEQSPGPITLKLMSAYADLIKNDIDP